MCQTALNGLIQEGDAVLELFGGDGEFAESLLLSNDKITKYHLVDLSLKSLLLARQKLSDVVLVHPCRVTLQIADVTRKDLDYGETFNVVLAIGGLTKQVLSTKAEALAALDLSVRSLRPEGYLLLAGHTYSWITSDDLIAAGLEVKNTFDPQRGKYIYIARKPASRGHSDEQVEIKWLDPSPLNIIEDYWRDS